MRLATFKTGKTIPVDIRVMYTNANGAGNTFGIIPIVYAMSMD